jgi:hypothetical protein
MNGKPEASARPRNREVVALVLSGEEVALSFSGAGAEPRREHEGSALILERTKRSAAGAELCTIMRSLRRGHTAMRLAHPLARHPPRRIVAAIRTSA